MGRAIVGAFCAEGASVIATDVNVEPLADLRGDIEIVQLDVTSAQQAHEVAQRFASTNVLVNCAGYVAMGNALECTREDFDASIDVNLRSILHMVHAFLPNMLARREGVIVNIASVVSTTMAAPRRFIYSATKGAVIAMTRSIALDFVREGIRCNSISPGTVDTPSLAVRLNAAADPDAARAALVQRQPLGRMGLAAEVAAVAVMLASAESSFMTGADVVVDGGISL
jgi:2-keto-3-deoxy-L-fuconate dehydrogenase